MTDFEIHREPVNQRIESVRSPVRVRYHWHGAGFHGGSRKRSQREIVFWSWLAATIDSLLISALSGMSLLLCLKLMGSITLWKTSGGEIFALVFVMNCFVYFLSFRVWLGYSIGEWACELRLGPLRLQRRPLYILKVFLRVSLSLATGFLFFPILSLIFKKDVLGTLIGLRLTSLNPLPKRN